MLEEGRRRAAEGLDVVVGYAEPHSRAETEAQLIGMDLLPTIAVEHRGVRLREFDLDGALARRPQLLLVDELPTRTRRARAIPSDIGTSSSCSTPASTSTRP